MIRNPGKQLCEGNELYAIMYIEIGLLDFD
jgi:hypothetical protein